MFLSSTRSVSRVFIYPNFQLKIPPVQSLTENLGTKSKVFPPSAESFPLELVEGNSPFTANPVE